ncbi:hypothetical protein [Psychrobacter fulvigenes]|uniref:hypothetical protein n=1 Tax=Psychrobacter fulvigenes TaxID=533323 RepID=UPI00191ACFC9|nr:hypothetical protein [Psychrobacter fulvigenes]
METALTYDVEELMGGLDFARMAGEIATRHGKILRVHLGLNSAGMSRNGLEMGTELLFEYHHKQGSFLGGDHHTQVSSQLLPFLHTCSSYLHHPEAY